MLTLSKCRSCLRRSNFTLIEQGCLVRVLLRKIIIQLTQLYYCVQDLLWVRINVFRQLKKNDRFVLYSCRFDVNMPWIKQVKAYWLLEINTYFFVIHSQKGTHSVKQYAFPTAVPLTDVLSRSPRGIVMQRKTDFGLDGLQMRTLT
jgi:hypothetical protein